MFPRIIFFSLVYVKKLSNLYFSVLPVASDTSVSSVSVPTARDLGAIFESNLTCLILNLFAVNLLCLIFLILGGLEAVSIVILLLITVTTYFSSSAQPLSLIILSSFSMLLFVL
jgi:hypothetical protein